MSKQKITIITKTNKDDHGVGIEISFSPTLATSAGEWMNLSPDEQRNQTLARKITEIISKTLEGEAEE